MIQILDIISKKVNKGYYNENEITVIGVGGLLKTFENIKNYFYVSFDEAYIQEILSTLQNLNIQYSLVNKFLPLYYQTKTTEVIKIIVNPDMNYHELMSTIKSIPGIIKLYESDIKIKNRFLIDNDYYGMQFIDENNQPLSLNKNDDLKVLAFDIEVLPPESLKMPTSDKDKIIVCSFAFSHEFEGHKTLVCIIGNGKNYDDVVFFQDEKTLLWYFNEIFQDYNPDIITGYNINGFDFKYIVDRETINYIKPNIGRGRSLNTFSQLFIKNMTMNNFVYIPGRVIFDLLPLVKKNYNYPSYNLKTISHELLGNDKIDMPMWKMRQEYINNDYKNTIDYARKDAILTLELLNKTKFLDKYIAISKLTGLLLQDVINTGQSAKIDMKIMREFKNENRIMANKPHNIKENEEEKDSSYDGAKVLTPTIGLSKDVVVLDYKSLYPTIMISQNYSYDTLIEKIDRNNFENDQINKAVVGGWFVKPEIKMGVVPKILNDLLNERIKIKKEMKQSEGAQKEFLDARQYALKLLLNSFYGYSGYARARLYEVDIAQAVTSFGRQNIGETKQYIEGLSSNYKVIYGDTDSVFIEVRDPNYQYGEIPLDILKNIGVKLGNGRSESLPAPMELLYEKIAKIIIFEAKKKYAYRHCEQNKNGIWEQKIKASGIETKRRDWCKLVGNTLSKCLDKVLLENDINGCIGIIRDAVTSVENRKYEIPNDLQDLVLSKKYTKPYNEYKVIPIHIRVAKKMIEANEQINIGDRIDYLIVEGDGKYNQRAQSMNEILKSKLEIDRKYYIETQLLPPIDRFMSTIGITRNTYYNGLNGNKKDKKLLMTNGKNVTQKNLFSYAE